MIKTISPHVRISFLVEFLSIYLHLNLLVYDLNIFGSALEVFGKCLGNVQKCLSGLWTNFGKSSEIFGKWSEIFGKSPKMLLCIVRNFYNEKKIIWSLGDINFSSRVVTRPCKIL